MENYFINETQFQIKNYYQDPAYLSYGASGTVISANDINNKRDVAIKKLSRSFEETRDTAKRCFREVFLMKKLKHENLIELFEVFTDAQDLNSFRNLYIVTNLMTTDLKTLLSTRIDIIENEIDFIPYQILRGLKYLHTSNIIHRDLKPSNITIDEQCNVKIIDFGLSRIKGVDMTDYVVTRWYRAPELLLNMFRNYSFYVDMWSFGCILVEMCTSLTLFRSTTRDEQILLILSLTGAPNEAFYQKIESEQERLEFKKIVNGVQHFGGFPITEIGDPSSVLNQKKRLARNLAEQMLKIDPSERPTSTEALSHEFFGVYKCPEDEPSGEPIADFEDQSASIQEWKISIESRNSMNAILNSKHNNCLTELLTTYSRCAGAYCGRLVVNQSECVYSNCGKCPRGFRPSEIGICEPCDKEPKMYDYMFLGFVLTIQIAANLIILDKACSKANNYIYNIANKTHKNKMKLSAIFLLPVLESILGFIFSVLAYSPFGKFKLKSCEIESLRDWYTMFYNPYVENYSKMNCTQEIVYPMYSIVFLIILFSTVCMIIFRPIVIGSLFKTKAVKEKLHESTLYVLYLNPILILIQAFAGGILYYSYPMIVLILFLITNAWHLTKEYKSVTSVSDNKLSENFIKFFKIMKLKRNILIVIVHIILFSYGLLALTQFKSFFTNNLLIMLLSPAPILFFIISYNFTEPKKFKPF